MTTFKNYSVDPFNNDQSYPLHIQTTHYAGAYDDFIVPAAANFPDAAAGSPTRVFFDFMGIINVSDLDGTKPFTLYDITDSVELTRTTAAPGDGEYRIVTNTNSIARQKIEFNIAQADHSIGADGYILGGVLSEHEVNLLVKGVTQVVLSDITSDTKSKAQADYIIDGDLSTKINSIITSYAGNVKISLLSGTYQSNNPYPIFINQNNVEIEGVGFVKITGTADLDNLFVIDAEKVKISNIEINYITSSSSTPAAINIGSLSKYITIDNVRITAWESTQNTNIYGIYITNGDYYNIINCDIQGVDSNGGTNTYGIYGANVGIRHIIINNNNIHELGDNTNQYGIVILYSADSDDIIIKNNIIRDVDNDAIQLNINGCIVVYNITIDYTTKIVDNMGGGSTNRINYNL